MKLLCWHRWIKQQERVLLSVRAEHLGIGLMISFFVLMFATLLSSIPETNGAPALNLGWGAWVVRALFAGVIGYGIYFLNTYATHDQVTLHSISDRTCYKCHKVVMDVTSRDIAIKNAEERLRAHRQNIHEVNSQMWKSGE